MEALWRTTFFGDERTADAHVSNLRRKIERDPSRPERIVTVRGAGYKLAPVPRERPSPAQVLAELGGDLPVRSAPPGDP